MPSVDLNELRRIQTALKGMRSRSTEDRNKVLLDDQIKAALRAQAEKELDPTLDARRRAALGAAADRQRGYGLLSGLSQTQWGGVKPSGGVPRMVEHMTEADKLDIKALDPVDSKMTKIANILQKVRQYNKPEKEEDYIKQSIDLYKSGLEKDKKDKEKTTLDFTQKKKAQDDLRKEIKGDQDYKAFSKVDKKARGVIVSLSKPGPLSDVASVFGFMTLLDPDSVVRESEVRLFGEAAGFIDQMLLLRDKIQGQAMITDGQRRELLYLIPKLHAIYQDAYNTKTKTYRKNADFYGLDWDMIDMGLGNKPLDIPTIGASAKEGHTFLYDPKTGIKFEVPNGKVEFFLKEGAVRERPDNAR